MSRFIESARYAGYKASGAEVMEMLGLKPTQHLPAEGMAPRVVQGITVWVNPLPDRGPGRHRKRSTHRVMARCRCGKVLSAGRLHQHKCR